MRKAIWLAGVMTLACLSITSAKTEAPAASAEQPTIEFPSDEAIRSTIGHYIAKGEVNAVVVGLLEPNGTRRIVGVGPAGPEAGEVGPDSLFELGSINKTFTATVLADMVRRGEVKLDDPVAKYLPPAVKVPSRNGKQITLRQLATHTSGLPRSPGGFTPPDMQNPYADYHEKDLYAFLSTHELERDPGEKSVYSNLGAGLLGHALMRAAKAKDFPSLVTERILKPLRMTATHYGLDPKLVPGYDRGGRPTKPWTVSVLAGAGGLNSSARDMLAYIDANVGPARSPIEVSMRLAHQPNSLGYGASRVSGLGWGIRQKDGRTILHHSGGTGGYRAFIAMEPAASRGVIVMTNRSQFAGADNIAIDLMFPPESAKAPATAREGK